jgi:hypothetical protein
MRRVLAGMSVVVTLAASAASAQTPAAGSYESMTYEQFMRDLKLEDRYRVFVDQMSPEKKATLMGTHYARCLTALGATLTAEQADIVRQAQAALTPDVYRRPPNEAAAAKMRAVEEHAQAVFSQELGVQIFTMESECKAK